MFLCKPSKVVIPTNWKPGIAKYFDKIPETSTAPALRGGNAAGLREASDSLRDLPNNSLNLALDLPDRLRSRDALNVLLMRSRRVPLIAGIDDVGSVGRERQQAKDCRRNKYLQH